MTWIIVGTIAGMAVGLWIGLVLGHGFAIFKFARGYLDAGLDERGRVVYWVTCLGARTSQNRAPGRIPERMLNTLFLGRNVRKDSQDDFSGPDHVGPRSALQAKHK